MEGYLKVEMSGFLIMVMVQGLKVWQLRIGFRPKQLSQIVFLKVLGGYPKVLRAASLKGECRKEVYQLVGYREGGTRSLKVMARKVLRYLIVVDAHLQLPLVDQT